MTAAPFAPLSLDEARVLAFALMAAEDRALAVLDQQVKVALGIRSTKRMRVDVLYGRLVALVDSYPLWRARARMAKRRLDTEAETLMPANAGQKVRA
ncbi:hypothetical protein [Nitrospirillum iridis]|uniref:Uncharacterized protein n=1 Tax=Nitrospirillum iridis TaxID=765888 RepID=A0A7X0EEG3_9PROT|nr:hypothetical protein [Nitrospirillum iridis]MBB6251414.1 hypothetical protein [Nitrospirillum iridis]